VSGGTEEDHDILLHIYTMHYKLQICHCHYAISDYHSNKLWNVDKLHGRKLCRRSRTNERSFAFIDQVKEDEMGKACSTYGAKMSAYKVLMRKRERRDH
jgi:hypothetical protein